MSVIDSTENVELDKLLFEIKRTILENRTFLENLKLEPFSECLEIEEQSLDGADDKLFEEL